MTTTEPNQEVTRAVKALMAASPQFRTAMENAAKTLVEFMDALNDNPEMREALKNAAASADAINDFQIEPSARKLAKVAEIEQAIRRMS